MYQMITCILYIRGFRMIRIIKNVRLFSPADQGLCHVVISHNKVLSILKATSDTCEYLDSLKDQLSLIEVIDGKNMWLTPGFVDGLVHSIGGGGEGGYHNRTPEIDADEVLENGVTTAVSALGTDAITRSLANLLGKSRELTAKGVSGYFYTGSYHLPPVTLTGNLDTDIVYIPEIIGIGELALSDIRGSVIQFNDLYSIGRRIRTSANLAGKKGIVFCHLGDHEDKLNLLTQVINQTDLPYSLFVPTHINRNPHLFEAGIQFALGGGFIDITTSTNQALLDDGEIFCSKALVELLDSGVDIKQISFSSDANASLPRFDEHGNTIGVDRGNISSLFEAVKVAVIEHKVPFDIALQCITSNPARNLGLLHKGTIDIDSDADLVLIDPENFTIKQVWSQGIPRLHSSCPTK